MTQQQATRRAGYYEGHFLAIFEPIRFEDGSPGWQGTYKDGRLHGILYANGNYDDAWASGNTEWKLCEETPEHRRILKKASQPWKDCPIEFRSE